VPGPRLFAHGARREARRIADEEPRREHLPHLGQLGGIGARAVQHARQGGEVRAIQLGDRGGGSVDARAREQEVVDVQRVAVAGALGEVRREARRGDTEIGARGGRAFRKLGDGHAIPPYHREP